MTILASGAACFIGSNFVLNWLPWSDEFVLNLGALTCAGNLQDLAAVDGDFRHIFKKGEFSLRVDGKRYKEKLTIEKDRFSSSFNEVRFSSDLRW